jgi:tripartite-type tricarboxylate transporter receptor subunit TctC
VKLPRRQILHLAAGAAALPAVSRIASAQTYPARPVHIIVGYAPGGSTDIVARLIGQWLSARLGQQFIIDNRPGASGNIGTELVVRAPPDGYTLLMALSSDAINATLYENLNFNFIRDITPVGGIVRVPNVMEVNTSFPAKTVPEFIAYAKANPGKINQASGGIGVPRAVSRRGARADRSTRRAGAGDVRPFALVNRAYQIRQAARVGSHDRDALGGAAGHPDC